MYMMKYYSLMTSLKDVPGGIPKSVILGVTVALIHVVGQIFMAGIMAAAFASQLFLSKLHCLTESALA